MNNNTLNYGTLKEIGAKVGDVVEWLGQPYTIEALEVVGNGPYAGSVRAELAGYGVGAFIHQKFRMIRRAGEDTPKLWRDMTPEEKGALLLAHHEGKVVQQHHGPFGFQDAVDLPLWQQDKIYRIRPEPKRETVTVYGAGFDWEQAALPCSEDTHRITFDLIDGEPDVSSIKMEKL